MSGYELIGTYYKKPSHNLIKLNINATKSVESILVKIKPEIIIWSAGLKNLSITEKSKSKSLKYNYYSVKMTPILNLIQQHISYLFQQIMFLKVIKGTINQTNSQPHYKLWN